MQPAPAGPSRTTVRVGLFVLGVVIVLSVAELMSQRFNAFTRDHSLISTFITEAVLLVGVYLVIDEIIQRRVDAPLERRDVLGDTRVVRSRRRRSRDHPAHRRRARRRDQE